jgi:hypothetical protein
MRRVVFVFASVVAACSGDDAPSIDTPEAFVAQAQQAACDALFRCSFTTTVHELPRAYLGDATRCTTLRAGAANLGWGSLDDLLAATRQGKTRYDGAAAYRCIARLGATCDIEHNLGELCADVFTGTVAAGAACQRHEECAGGGWCDRGQAMAMNACPGMCRARKRIGETCSVNDECAPMAVGQRAECFPDASGSSRCVRVATGEAGAEGRPCGHIIGAAYAQDIQCAAGLGCVVAEGSLAGTCQRPAATGAACGATTVCARGAACTATTTMTCAAITVRRAVGERCNNATMELCDPWARLVCRSGTCASIGDGTMGATCGNMAVPAGSQCNAGLYCATGRCVARKADGEACASDVECRTDACDRATRTCAARTCR